VKVTLRRGVAAAAVALALPALVSCGSNFNAPTDQVYTPAQGVNDRSSDVDVLNALIVSGEDGSGTLIAGLANNREERADTLTQVGGAGPDAGITVNGPSGGTEIPAGGYVQLADEGAYSVEASQVQPGRFITVAFSFENSAQVTMQIPVVSADEADFTDVPLPSESASLLPTDSTSEPAGGASESASATPTP
jgi:hypothetical protein